jgi:hypothetical protein
MPDEPTVASTPAAMLWTGRVLSGLVTAFLLMDGVMKLIKPQFIVDATEQMGLGSDTIVPLGIVLTASTILYAIPRTAALGAILLTGYLGGAVATHVFVRDGAFGVIFATTIGILAWVGLWLRDARVRALMPVRI